MKLERSVMSEMAIMQQFCYVPVGVHDNEDVVICKGATIGIDLPTLIDLADITGILMPCQDIDAEWGYYFMSEDEAGYNVGGTLYDPVEATSDLCETINLEKVTAFDYREAFGVFYSIVDHRNILMLSIFDEDPSLLEYPRFENEYREALNTAHGQNVRDYSRVSKLFEAYVNYQTKTKESRRALIFSVLTQGLEEIENKFENVLTIYQEKGSMIEQLDDLSYGIYSQLQNDPFANNYMVSYPYTLTYFTHYTVDSQLRQKAADGYSSLLTQKDPTKSVAELLSLLLEEVIQHLRLLKEDVSLLSQNMDPAHFTTRDEVKDEINFILDAVFGNCMYLYKGINSSDIYSLLTSALTEQVTSFWISDVFVVEASIDYYAYLHVYRNVLMKDARISTINMLFPETTNPLSYLAEGGLNSLEMQLMTFSDYQTLLGGLDLYVLYQNYCVMDYTCQGYANSMFKNYNNHADYFSFFKNLSYFLYIFTRSPDGEKYLENMFPAPSLPLTPITNITPLYSKQTLEGRRMLNGRYIKSYFSPFIVCKDINDCEDSAKTSWSWAESKRQLEQDSFIQDIEGSSFRLVQLASFPKETKVLVIHPNATQIEDVVKPLAYSFSNYQKVPPLILRVSRSSNPDKLYYYELNGALDGEFSFVSENQLNDENIDASKYYDSNGVLSSCAERLFGNVEFAPHFVAFKKSDNVCTHLFKHQMLNVLGDGESTDFSIVAIISFDSAHVLNDNVVYELLGIVNYVSLGIMQSPDGVEIMLIDKTTNTAIHSTASQPESLLYPQYDMNRTQIYDSVTVVELYTYNTGDSTVISFAFGDVTDTCIHSKMSPAANVIFIGGEQGTIRITSGNAQSSLVPMRVFDLKAANMYLRNSRTNLFQSNTLDISSQAYSATNLMKQFGVVYSTTTKVKIFLEVANLYNHQYSCMTKEDYASGATATNVSRQGNTSIQNLGLIFIRQIRTYWAMLPVSKLALHCKDRTLSGLNNNNTISCNEGGTAIEIKSSADADVIIGCPVPFVNMNDNRCTCSTGMYEILSLSSLKITLNTTDIGAVSILDYKGDTIEANVVVNNNTIELAFPQSYVSSIQIQTGVDKAIVNIQIQDTVIFNEMTSTDKGILAINAQDIISKAHDTLDGFSFTYRTCISCPDNAAYSLLPRNKSTDCVCMPPYDSRVSSAGIRECTIDVVPFKEGTAELADYYNIRFQPDLLVGKEITESTTITVNKRDERIEVGALLFQNRYDSVVYQESISNLDEPGRYWYVFGKSEDGEIDVLVHQTCMIPSVFFEKEVVGNVCHVTITNRQAVALQLGVGEDDVNVVSQAEYGIRGYLSNEFDVTRNETVSVRYSLNVHSDDPLSCSPSEFVSIGCVIEKAYQPFSSEFMAKYEIVDEIMTMAKTTISMTQLMKQSLLSFASESFDNQSVWDAEDLSLMTRLFCPVRLFDVNAPLIVNTNTVLLFDAWYLNTEYDWSLTIESDGTTFAGIWDRHRNTFAITTPDRPTEALLVLQEAGGFHSQIPIVVTNADATLDISIEKYTDSKQLRIETQDKALVYLIKDTKGGEYQKQCEEVCVGLDIGQLSSDVTSSRVSMPYLVSGTTSIEYDVFDDTDIMCIFPIRFGEQGTPSHGQPSSVQASTFRAVHILQKEPVQYDTLYSFVDVSICIPLLLFLAILLEAVLLCVQYMFTDKLSRHQDIRRPVQGECLECRALTKLYPCEEVLALAPNSRKIDFNSFSDKMREEFERLEIHVHADDFETLSYVCLQCLRTKYMAHLISVLPKSE